MRTPLQTLLKTPSKEEKKIFNADPIAASFKLLELIAQGKSTSYSMYEQAPQEAIGAIDFRGSAMKLNYQAMGRFEGMDLRLPQLSDARLAQIDIDTGIREIKGMVSSGIRPSESKITELVAACEQKGKMSVYSSDFLLCLAGAFALEEIDGDESSPVSQKLLVFLDSRN